MSEQEVELPLVGLTVSIAEAHAQLEKIEKRSCGKHLTSEMVGYMNDLYIAHICSLINDESSPSLPGIKADLYRVQMSVVESFMEKYPEMEGCEEELYAMVNEIDLSTVCGS